MHYKRIGLLLLTAALLLTLAAPALAADPATIRIDAPAAVKAGETFDVQVRIEGNPGLCAVQFTLQFDRSQLRCDSCTAGEMLDAALCVTNPDAERGAILAAATTKTITGDGTLAVCRFTALTDGNPSFRLGNTVFAGKDAEELTVTVVQPEGPAPGGSDETEQPAFSDISGSFAEDAIEKAAELGLILGYNGKYRPEDGMTRGECVTILYRAMGSPAVKGPATFTDLTKNYYRTPIAWSEECGAVKGVGGGRFAPEGGVTRAQLATILYRLAGEERGMETLLAGMYEETFSDADRVPDYAKAAVWWAVYKGIWCGTESLQPGTELAPNEPATRAQIAVMITRYLEKYPVE